MEAKKEKTTITDDHYLLDRMKKLKTLGRAIFSESDHLVLLELILSSMQELTHAEGGTLYYLKSNKLSFEVFNNRVLKMNLGGKSSNVIPFGPLSLYDANGEPNLSNVACYAAIKDEVINIPDVYDTGGSFDFSAVKQYDKTLGYRTKSMLTMPIKNHVGEIIGVLQLINATDRKSNQISHFTDEDEEFVVFLSFLAGVTLTNYHLTMDMEKLFESFVTVLASAIDDKSSYTGDHCRRVPIVASMLNEALCEVDYGPMAHYDLSEVERYELELAALLHDCGKISTPVHVMDKATKLETIFDRVHLIDTRFEIIYRDFKISMLEKKLKLLENYVKGDKDIAHFYTELDSRLENVTKKLLDDREFLRSCNTGEEAMPHENVERIFLIGKEYKWKNLDNEVSNFLTSDELKNLIVMKGTLTKEERDIINHHADMSVSMLEKMHFPQHLRRIPEIAASHHECMDGSGYPKGLRKEDMTIQARLMGVADVFEALTATDRPYKKGKKLSEVLFIMGNMSIKQRIDSDIFDVFVDKKIYLEYARKFLSPDQIDEVDVKNIPGYRSYDERMQVDDYFDEGPGIVTYVGNKTVDEEDEKESGLQDKSKSKNKKKVA